MRLAVLCGLARAADMKTYSTHGFLVLLAPRESYGPETGWSGRGPAPAGALQRASAAGYEAETGPLDDPHDTPFESRRSGSRLRLKLSLPKSRTGRIVAGSAAFVAVAASLALMLGVRSYVLHDERFVIPSSAQIETQGNVHLTRAQLLSVFGEDVERNIFKVPLAERRADLERLPWVAHATVMRLLPNRIRISIVERTPVAFVRQGTHIGLVDASGVLLDMPSDAPGDSHYSFPVLTGISAADPQTTRAARMEIYRRFVKELDGSGEKISDSLSEVDISSPEDVKALIPSGSTDLLVHFGNEQFLERYRHFQEHLSEWKQQYPKLASADMRYERQVVLEMQPGAAVPTNEAIAPAGTTDDGAAPTPVAPAKVLAKATTPKAPAHVAAKPVSASNERMFAALAAARKSQTAIPAQVHP